MPKLLEWQARSAFDIGTVELLREIFDDVWAQLEPELGERATEAVRRELANFVLEFAQEHELGGLQLNRKVARAMRVRYGIAAPHR